MTKIKSEIPTTARDELRFSLHRGFLRALDERQTHTEYQLATP